MLGVHAHEAAKQCVLGMNDHSSPLGDHGRYPAFLMAFPKKRRRQIKVDGELYFWICNFETKRQGSTAIQLASGAGSLVKAMLIGEPTPSTIEATIRFAKLNGWEPATSKNVELFVNACEIPATVCLVPMFNNATTRRRWISIKSTLEFAKYLLSNEFVDLDFVQFEQYLNHNELESALDELESVGISSANALGFWRRLRDAAVELELKGRAERFNDRISELSQ